MQRAATTLVVRTGDGEGAVVVLGDGDGLGDGQRQGALGALDRDVLAVDGDVDSRGDWRPAAFQYATWWWPPLPDVGEDFAAHALLGRLAIGEQAGGRGDDRHAEAAQNLGQIGGFRVHTQTGLGDAAHAGEAALTAGAVLEVDDEGLAHLGVLGAVIGDVALALEDLGDVRLDLRVGQLHLDRGTPSWRCADASRSLRSDRSWSWLTCSPFSQRFPLPVPAQAYRQ